MCAVCAHMDVKYYCNYASSMVDIHTKKHNFVLASVFLCAIHDQKHNLHT